MLIRLAAPASPTARHRCCRPGGACRRSSRSPLGVRHGGDLVGDAGPGSSAASRRPDRPAAAGRPDRRRDDGRGSRTPHRSARAASVSAVAERAQRALQHASQLGCAHIENRPGRRVGPPLRSPAARTVATAAATVPSSAIGQPSARGHRPSAASTRSRARAIDVGAVPGFRRGDDQRAAQRRKSGGRRGRWQCGPRPRPTRCHDRALPTIASSTVSASACNRPATLSHASASSIRASGRQVSTCATVGRVTAARSRSAPASSAAASSSTDRRGRANPILYRRTESAHFSGDDAGACPDCPAQNPAMPRSRVSGRPQVRQQCGVSRSASAPQRGGIDGDRLGHGSCWHVGRGRRFSAIHRH